MLPAAGIVMGLFWAAMVLIVLVAFARVRAGLRPRDSGLADDDIRAIEETGTLRREDEPLDLDAIEEEERRFWDEEWDEAEEW